MEDYQILIDHAWSLDPDLFSLFREHFQIHLNKRRSIVEFQGKITEAGRRRYWQRWRLCRYGIPAYKNRYQLGIRPSDSMAAPVCGAPLRDILPRKIAWDKLPLNPSNTWGPTFGSHLLTPIDFMHAPQYSIAGLRFEPDSWLDEDGFDRSFDFIDGQDNLPRGEATPRKLFEMDDIRQVCEEFGWEMPNAANEATKPRPYVRALMELEG